MNSKFIAILACACLFAAQACKKEAQAPQEKKQINASALASQPGYGPFNTEQVTDPLVIADVNTYISSNVPAAIQVEINGVMETLTFNTSNLHYTSVDDEDVSVSTYYTNATNNFGDIEYSLAILHSSITGSYTGYMLVKANHISATYSEITYYNSSNQEIFTLEIDQTTGTTTARVNAPSGQSVADCIGDFYTKKGWLSVGLWVGTLLDPGIGVCVATACIAGETIKANH